MTEPTVRLALVICLIPYLILVRFLRIEIARPSQHLRRWAREIYTTLVLMPKEKTEWESCGHENKPPNTFTVGSKISPRHGFQTSRL